MSALLPWIAVIVTIIAGWALLKRYQTHLVLLFAGLVILVCVALMGDASFLPKGVKPSGFFLFDIFNTLKSIATKQSAGIGFLIMTAGGFAAYMDRIGASKALVKLCVKPLSAVRSPYVLLAITYVVGQFMALFINSAVGLGLLLMASVYPLLVALGVSRASAAAVIGSTCCLDLGPSSSNAMRAADPTSSPTSSRARFPLPSA